MAVRYLVYFDPPPPHLSARRLIVLCQGDIEWRQTLQIFTYPLGPGATADLLRDGIARVANAINEAVRQSTRRAQITIGRTLHWEEAQALRQVVYQRIRADLARP
jgi:hypothetical protein